MDECEAELAACFEDASCLSDSAAVVVDVLQGHEADHEVELGIREGKFRGVRALHLDVRVRLAGGTDHLFGRIDSDDHVAKLLQVAREPSFATAEIERTSARAWHEFQEKVAMKVPIAVVVRGSSPRDEGAG